MKRAIYIGKPWNPVSQNQIFSYGITGQSTPWRGSDILCDFLPDGGYAAVLTPRSSLYIPSEDQTCHCTKP